MPYKVAAAVFTIPTLMPIFLTFLYGVIRAAMKADFLSSKSFWPKCIVNKRLAKDFRSLFVTYTQKIEIIKNKVSAIAY